MLGGQRCRRRPSKRWTWPSTTASASILPASPWREPSSLRAASSRALALEQRLVAVRWYLSARRNELDCSFQGGPSRYHPTCVPFQVAQQKRKFLHQRRCLRPMCKIVAGDGDQREVHMPRSANAGISVLAVLRAQPHVHSWCPLSAPQCGWMVVDLTLDSRTATRSLCIVLSAVRSWNFGQNRQHAASFTVAGLWLASMPV